MRHLLFLLSWLDLALTLPSAERVCSETASQPLCLPPTYSKFELPFPNSVNVVEIGIDISDVLRINDKVSCI